MSTLHLGVGLTVQEENELYGLPKYSKGMAFKTHDSTNYYLQRDHDVLHLNAACFCLNTLHIGFLNRLEDKVSITVQEFTVNVKKAIYEEDLYNFWDKI
jgi:hypothetical protein